MNWDLFVTWLSEKGQGTWGEFKAAHDWLSRRSAAGATQAWTTARDLSALGHIEISWQDGGSWAIAPPVLTLLPDSGRALLTGARTRLLYVPPRYEDPPENRGSGLLVDAVDELELWLDPWWQRNGPTTVTIAIERGADARLLADTLEIPYTYAVAEQVAKLLPSLPAFQRLWQPGELLRGFDAERFHPGNCLWDPVDEFDEPGLYRCRTWSRHIHAMKTPLGAWVRVPPEPAVYEVLRWEGRQVLEYDEQKRELTVPGTAALPLLAARAATLCSGRVPRRIKQPGSWSRVTYLNVTRMVGERIAQSLEQELAHV